MAWPMAVAELFKLRWSKPVRSHSQWCLGYLKVKEQGHIRGIGTFRIRQYRNKYDSLCLTLLPVDFIWESTWNLVIPPVSLKIIHPSSVVLHHKWHYLSRLCRRTESSAGRAVLLTHTLKWSPQDDGREKLEALCERCHTLPPGWINLCATVINLACRILASFQTVHVW